jgi:hypothetical protein
MHAYARSIGRTLAFGTHVQLNVCRVVEIFELMGNDLHSCRIGRASGLQQPMAKTDGQAPERRLRPLALRLCGRSIHNAVHAAHITLPSARSTSGMGQVGSGWRSGSFGLLAKFYVVLPLSLRRHQRRTRLNGKVAWTGGAGLPVGAGLYP